MGRPVGSVAPGTAASTGRCSRVSWWRRVFVPAAGVSVRGCTGWTGRTHLGLEALDRGFEVVQEGVVSAQRGVDAREKRRAWVHREAGSGVVGRRRGGNQREPGMRSATTQPPNHATVHTTMRQSTQPRFPRYCLPQMEARG